MAPEPISATYFINHSHQSLCLYVYPSIVGRQGLCKIVTAATNTHANNRRIVRLVDFYAVCVVSKESNRLVLPRTFCSFVHYRMSQASWYNVCFVLHSS
jgi:hypothetical protein